MVMDAEKEAKMKDVLKQLDENHNIVIVFSTTECARDIPRLYEAVSKKYKKICIVTVNKPAISLVQELKERGVDEKKYCFIDCVTTEKLGGTPSKECVYISSSSALTELAIEITKMAKKEVELVILDNISSLLIYNDELLLTRFLHRVMSLIKLEDKRAVYTIMQKDMKGLIKDISLFADVIVEC